MVDKPHLQNLRGVKMLQVPVTRSGDSQARVTLDGKTYIFRTRYNKRNQRIFLDIFDKFGEVLISGIRLVENVALTDIYTRSEGGIPSGSLVVQQIDQTVKGAYATLGNLGIDLPFIFVYLSESEFESN